jgi:hypothetical protein
MISFPIWAARSTFGPPAEANLAPASLLASPPARAPAPVPDRDRGQPPCGRHASAPMAVGALASLATTPSPYRPLARASPSFFHSPLTSLRPTATAASRAASSATARCRITRWCHAPPPHHHCPIRLTRSSASPSSFSCSCPHHHFRSG